MKYKQYTIEELEPLIGKSCDLVCKATGIIGVYEVFIIGVSLVSGYTGRQAIEIPHRRLAYVRVRNQIDGFNMGNTYEHPVQFITNVRDERVIKGRIHPHEIKMIERFKKTPVAPYYSVDTKELGGTAYRKNQLLHFRSGKIDNALAWPNWGGMLEDRKLGQPPKVTRKTSEMSVRVKR